MRLLITGASSGLGEALAREYHRRDPGVTLGLVGRRPAELQRVADAVGNGQVGCYPLDVNDRGALAGAARDFIARFGLPDIVIASAGISHGTVTGDERHGEVFEKIIRTNLVAMFDTFAPFIAGMKQARHGCLVGIASVAGIRGMPGAGGYSASKAAVITYLESLRVELRDSGVQVVTIVPGYIRSPMTQGNAYRMPFLTDAGVFARTAADAIAAGRSFTVIPWQMRIVAGALRAMPNVLYDRLFARAPRKAPLAAHESDPRS